MTESDTARLLDNDAHCWIRAKTNSDNGTVRAHAVHILTVLHEQRDTIDALKAEVERLKKSNEWLLSEKNSLTNHAATARNVLDQQADRIAKLEEALRKIMKMSSLSITGRRIKVIALRALEKNNGTA